MAAAGTTHCIDGQRDLSASEVVFEFALNRLRLKQGFSLSEFEASSGLGSNCITALLHQAQADGLLALHGDRVQHTDRGWQFLNDLMERFLPEEVHDAGSHQD